MSSRNQSLDVLRGVAILMVLACHYGEPPYFRVFAAIGWSGVDLFFVLSGFLISGLLFSEYAKTGTINVKRFWIRRGFKIYPPFYALIVTTAIAYLLLTKTVPKEILSDVFFLQNYLPSVWSHGWSLAVEEHFYILLPLLLLAMTRIDNSNPFRFVPAISVALTVLCLYLRVLTSAHHADWAKVVAPTHLRMDALFAGVALGYYHHFDNASFRRCGRFPLWLPGLALLVPPFLLEGTIFMGTAGLTFTFLGYALIVTWAVNRPASGNPLVKLMARIGYFSYSIYLWHRAVAVVLFDRFPQNAFLCVAYLATSITLGIVLSKLLEIPSLRIRDRYFPSGGAQKRPEGAPRASGDTKESNRGESMQNTIRPSTATSPSISTRTLMP